MKTIYCLLLLLCPYLNHAQQQVTALDIGQHMPRVVCSNVLNNASAAIELSAYRGKLLLLDFMRTTCIGCFEKLPLYQQLQSRFNDRIQVILVTDQKTAMVKKFLQNHRLGRQVQLPVISNDSLLGALFPYQAVPHIVWIGPDEKVKAITDGDYVNEKNILQVLEGNAINWPVKMDVPDFDYTKALLTTNEAVQRLQQLPFNSSALLPHVRDVGQYHVLWQADSAAATVRTAFYNQPITEMYLRLMGRFYFPHSQVVLQVKDSSRYIFDENIHYRRQWETTNTWCYEAVLPAAMPRQLQQQRIWQELDFYFGIRTSLEQREVNCLLLQPLKTPVSKTFAAGASISVDGITNLLNRQYSNCPVVVEDDTLRRVRLPIKKEELHNREVIIRRLNDCGFTLVPAIRKMEVLVITETTF